MTSILKADTIQDTDGNNIINESGNTITIGASGDTISIPSGATFNINGTAGTGIGTNTPAFKAVNTGAVTIAHDTNTKLAITNEIYDVGSGYDASNSKFVVPSGEAGTYYFEAGLTMDNLTNPLYARLYKNGSQLQKFVTSSFSAVVSVYDVASVSDYYEFYVYQASGGGVATNGAGYTHFSGIKIIT